MRLLPGTSTRSSYEPVRVSRLVVALRAASAVAPENFDVHLRSTAISSGTVVSVTSMVPPNAMASNTTRAPAQLSVERSGSPRTAPNQPPACDMASTLATILSSPFATCSKPRTANTTMVQPTVRRTRCSMLRRRTMATPMPTTTTGSANRPRPNSQPNEVSIASPKGPAMCRYNDNTNKMPAEISPTPQNSTSRPRTTLWETGVSFFGCFFVPPDDVREPLPDMKNRVPMGWLGHRDTPKAPSS